jgi:YdjC-like protein
VTDLDGHGHCHAHPAATGVVLRLAKRHGIVHVRMPAEPTLWKPGRTPSTRFAEKVLLNLAVTMPRLAWKSQLRFPSAFYGFSHGGRMAEAVVRKVAESAPLGVSELMVHVGIANEEAPGFWTGYDYAGDLRAVTTRTKYEFERKFGISLVRPAPGGLDGIR